jgi:U6 snRNA-associated Sm-like protein LSm1
MEVEALSLKEAQDRKLADKKKQAKLQGLGFEVEHAGEILF